MRRSLCFQWHESEKGIKISSNHEFFHTSRFLSLCGYCDIFHFQKLLLHLDLEGKAIFRNTNTRQVPLGNGNPTIKAHTNTSMCSREEVRSCISYPRILSKHSGIGKYIQPGHSLGW